MTGAIGPAGGATCGISIVGGTAMCWTLPALLWALLAAGLTLLLLLLLLGLLVGWCLRAAATPSGAGVALRSMCIVNAKSHKDSYDWQKPGRKRARYRCASCAKAYTCGGYAFRP